MGRNNWGELARWLGTPEGDGVVDAAVLGCWPLYEADELLEDYGFVPSVENRRKLGRLIDAAAVEV